MAKKKLTYVSALVYSTDNTLKLQENKDDNITTVPPENQKLQVSVDKKQRAGKIVTLVTGFKGKEEDLEALSRQLKTSCGTGGSFKDGDIIIQGDNKDKICKWLQTNGYKQVKKV